ncbi:MAG: hypothetical protein ABFQ95_03190 [Pseudomonadota bacterium]
MKNLAAISCLLTSSLVVSNTASGSDCPDIVGDKEVEFYQAIKESKALSDDFKHKVFVFDNKKWFISREYADPKPINNPKSIITSGSKKVVQDGIDFIKSEIVENPKRLRCYYRLHWIRTYMRELGRLAHTDFHISYVYPPND